MSKDKGINEYDRLISNDYLLDVSYNETDRIKMDIYYIILYITVGINLRTSCVKQ